MDSKKIDSDSIVDVVFHLKWKSEVATHTDVYQASRINIWRDFLPPFLVKELNGKQAGDRIEAHLKSDESLPAFDERNRFQIKSSQFDRRFATDAVAEPGVGRFYPRGMLKDVTGVFKANVQPFRCVQLNNGHMQVDFNHPLSGKDLVLSGLVGKVETKESERGGSSVDWMEVITSGPGMQARWQTQPTDFFCAGAFDREDESPDSLFYSKPRYVQHIDDTAVEMVKTPTGGF